MSSNTNGGGGGGGRVSIPRNLKKTIHNIKEIAGSHSDEDVFFMLQECNMDPDETAHKLLLLDTFHEVKKKRDRKKENANKEPADPRLTFVVQGKGNRGSRPFHDAGGGNRNSTSRKENWTCHVPEDSVGISTRRVTSYNKGTCVTSHSILIVDSPAGTAFQSKSVGHDGRQFSEGGNYQFVKAAANIAKLDSALRFKSMAESSKTPTDAFEMGDACEKLCQSSRNSPSCRTSTPPGPHFSDSDHVLVPSQDSGLLSNVGIIKREVGSHIIPSEQILVVPDDRKSIGVSSVVGSSFVQGKIPNETEASKNQVLESSQAAPSTLGALSVGRNSSNHSNKSLQVISLQKGPNKEWKPKPSNPIFSQRSEMGVSSEIPVVLPKAEFNLHPAANVLDARQTTSELEKKLGESQISDMQHVIIPSHLHVPEVEKLGFCFGSFGANFTLNSSRSSPEDDKSPSFSETSEVTKERVEEQPSTLNVLVTTEEGDFSNCPPSSSHVPEVLVSGEGDISSTVALEYNEPKQETDLAPEGHPYSFVHTSGNYSFGIMPPMTGNLVPPFESIEAQGHDLSCLPSFVLPFEAASYYAQFYRSGSDTDGRILPLNSTGFSTKFNGNASMLLSQTSQSPEEAGNSLIMSAAGTAPLVTQAPAVMQSSIAVAQQPLHVFRHPIGMHLPHYPINFIPYSHYFSPFYVQPLAIHQFLSNGAVPPQPQADGVYPALPVATNKYSLPQYKPGGTAGNSTHMGVPGNYGTYGSSPTGFHLSSETTGNSTSTDDLIASEFKENNTFMTGQQTEGSGVWIAAPPGTEISGLPTSSFYNLPQAQMIYAATQAGHGSFSGMYNPTQSVTAAAIHPLIQQSQTVAGVFDMSGPVSSVYQPSQRAPTNCPNNF